MKYIGSDLPSISDTQCLITSFHKFLGMLSLVSTSDTRIDEFLFIPSIGSLQVGGWAPSEL